jgi:hypothetical protein
MAMGGYLDSMIVSFCIAWRHIRGVCEWSMISLMKDNGSNNQQGGIDEQFELRKSIVCCTRLGKQGE